MTNDNDPVPDDTHRMRHPGGDPVKLSLTAIEQDVLYHHLMETIEDAGEGEQQILDDVIDRLPEHDIVTRPLSMETLVEIGYFDNPLGEADLNV